MIVPEKRKLVELNLVESIRHSKPIEEGDWDCRKIKMSFDLMLKLGDTHTQDCYTSV